jgi:hypothetical protein
MDARTVLRDYYPELSHEQVEHLLGVYGLWREHAERQIKIPRGLYAAFLAGMEADMSGKTMRKMLSGLFMGQRNEHLDLALGACVAELVEVAREAQEGAKP